MLEIDLMVVSFLGVSTGWQALRWEDVMKVVVKFGETIDEKKCVRVLSLIFTFQHLY